ncbi:ion transporter [bacterium]|nr:MAG: ion transporter [bacterium]
MGWRLYKELVFALLAVISVGTVAYDYAVHPTAYTSRLIFEFDIVVAYIFLGDFFITWLLTKQKRGYLRRNWYLLLASIPMTYAWAELLRGLRLLELVRLIRAAQHAQIVWETARRYRKV